MKRKELSSEQNNEQKRITETMDAEEAVVVDVDDTPIYKNM